MTTNSQASQREGLSFDIGMSMVTDDPNEGAVPLLYLGLGYYSSPQAYVGVKLDSILLVNILALQGKYYFEDSKYTPFVLGSIGGYMAGGHGSSEGVTSTVGLGYAFDELEIDISGIFIDDSVAGMLGIHYHF